MNMKSVMLSIKPQWCEKIASGEKTIEVRKSAPKEVPFKCYIYCCKGKPYLYRVDDDDNFELARTLRAKVDGYVKDYNEQNGKVIGEFICNEVERFMVGSLRSDDIEKLACLSYNEMISYFYKPEELDGETTKQGFAWHISNLKIYDEPKELNEFQKPCKMELPMCERCEHYSIWDNRCENITRPPQSWCYVEEI